MLADRPNALACRSWYKNANSAIDIRDELASRRVDEVLTDGIDRDGVDEAVDDGVDGIATHGVGVTDEREVDGIATHGVDVADDSGVDGFSEPWVDDAVAEEAEGIASGRVDDSDDAWVEELATLGVDEADDDGVDEPASKGVDEQDAGGRHRETMISQFDHCRQPRDFHDKIRRGAGGRGLRSRIDSARTNLIISDRWCAGQSGARER